MVTSPRSGPGRLAVPWRRRNRKREAPIWRRLPELARALARFLVTWLRRSLPVSITLVVSAALIIGVASGYFFITTSDRFAIRAIAVHGNEALSAERIVAQLDVHIGDNIFQIRLDELEGRLERNPSIARAMVRRALPSTLLVEITENHPAALVELDGLYLADEQGHIFKRAAITQGDGAGLPIVTGLTRADYIARPASVQKSIQDALAAAALYRQGADRPALGEIHVHPRRGITVLGHDSGLAVQLGQSDPAALEARLQAFDRVWQSLGPAERARVRAIHASDSYPSGRVTVAFADTE